MDDVTVKGARLLNERVGWWGLSVFDLAALGYFLIILNSLLKPYGLELLAFPVIGLAFIFLLSIRLKSRPKTIRDFIKSKMKSQKMNHLLSPVNKGRK